MPLPLAQQPDLAALDAEFAALQAGFIQRLPERRQRMEPLLKDLLSAESAVDLQSLKLLHREVHNLVGAAGSYQLSDLSQSARQLERVLWSLLSDVPPAVSTKVRQEFQQLTASLFTLMQHPSSAGQAQR